MSGTQHHWYTIVNRSGGEALISGHPNYCPEPVPVRIEGSTWMGSMLKLRFIGRGMHLEFRHPTYHTITTSRVVESGPRLEKTREDAPGPTTLRSTKPDTVPPATPPMFADVSPPMSL